MVFMSKSQNQSPSTIKSFNYIANPRAKVLILGSMPGVISLDHQQYYAHPRNSFWPIIESLFAPKEGDSNLKENALYQKRLQLIKNQGIALWDVLAECQRNGSLDSNIDTKTVSLNDFASLFAYAPDIKTIFFNGKTAEKLFKQHALSKNKDLFEKFSLIILPSTSPAYAKMPFSEKLLEWKKVKSWLNKQSTCG